MKCGFYMNRKEYIMEDNILKYNKTWAIVHGRMRRKGITSPYSKWITTKILKPYKQKLLNN